MKRKYIDDHELIDLVLQGDEKALAILMDKYKAMLFRILYAYRDRLMDKFDAKELYQLSTISLYHAVLSYNSDTKCSFSTYLKIIVDRDILAYVRRMQRDRNKANLYSISLDQEVKEADGLYLVEMVENNQSYFDPHELLAFKELGTLVNEQLAAFSKQEQQVFWLWYAGYRYHEIAQISGYNEKKIGYLLMRMRKKLKGSIDSAYTL
ncbi:MAG: sigma-70 family RNA polymerase sigma factor [Clostridia bacterium]|nr:sigma-70 family RNA polymerase sigma factor [Erysipelotrichia bacterium]NCC87271.1 sigma-70 family RNA polymerase sigma factor [Clostridia bacterium]